MAKLYEVGIVVNVLDFIIDHPMYIYGGEIGLMAARPLLLCS
jgi:hypothetical protein